MKKPWIETLNHTHPLFFPNLQTVYACRSWGPIIFGAHGSHPWATAPFSTAWPSWIGRVVATLDDRIWFSRANLSIPNFESGNQQHLWLDLQLLTVPVVLLVAGSGCCDQWPPFPVAEKSPCRHLRCLRGNKDGHQPMPAENPPSRDGFIRWCST